MNIRPVPIAALFESEDDRLDRFSMAAAGIWFDFSKTHLSAKALTDGVQRIEAAGLEAWRTRLFAGDIVNISEGRAAEHCAERGRGHPDSVGLAARLHRRMQALVGAVNDGLLGDIRHVLHLGIGGSALGPDLLVDALGEDALYEVAVVSNVDGVALKRACARFDPHHTLVVIASKTFTTTETMLNARSAVEWLEEAGVEDPYGQIIAITAAPDAAAEWGVDDTRILPFSESVGGRYSLWSSIGFPAALALGTEAFARLHEGAAAMDEHFATADMARNAPVLAALIDRHYVEQERCQTRAVFAYDERLRKLPFYLQQLEMESNGKSVDRDGKPLAMASAPITWGGTGTDAQHAVFQLLHQGSVQVPIEFVAAIEPGHDLDEGHHRQLLANCFAQASALMTGRSCSDPARSYGGDRPSVTILLDRLDPYTLGALLAFYEHRTFVNAVLIGNNPFDQFGVEFGKKIAHEIESGEAVDSDPSTAALIRRAGL